MKVKSPNQNQKCTQKIKATNTLRRKIQKINHKVINYKVKQLEMGNFCIYKNNYNINMKILM